MSRIDVDHKLIEDMSIEELRALKAARYDNAIENDIVAKVWIIGEQLGTGSATRLWSEDCVEIMTDSYGDYATVCYNGKRVLSTHATERFAMPGEWEDVILKWYPVAERKIKDNQHEAEIRARTELITKYIGG